MSQDNVDFLRRAAASIEPGDAEAFLELFHPDVEARDLVHLPDMPELLRGRGAVAGMFEQWMEALDSWTVDITDFVDAHPWVVCGMHWRAAGKGSGVPTEWRLADAYEVRDGQIVRAVFGYPDVETALQAVRSGG